MNYQTKYFFSVLFILFFCFADSDVLAQPSVEVSQEKVKQMFEELTNYELYINSQDKIDAEFLSQYIPLGAEKENVLRALKKEGFEVKKSNPENYNPFQKEKYDEFYSAKKGFKNKSWVFNDYSVSVFPRFKDGKLKDIVGSVNWSDRPWWLRL